MQVLRISVDFSARLAEARRQPHREWRRAQDPHRVFAERFGDMAQHLVAQVALAVEWIDQVCRIYRKSG